MVGLTGVEPVTSRLSGERSNQLSYRPIGVRGSQAGARCAPGGAVCLAAGPTLVPRRSVLYPNQNGFEPKTDTRGVGKG